MTDELPTSLFNILRDDVSGMRKEINTRLDKLVTREAFEAEQRRVDAKISDLGTDLVNETKARTDGDTDIRNTASIAADTARKAQQLQQTRRVSLNQGLLIALVSVLGSGIVGLGVVIIQNAAHLG
jgi:hypothetical protein